MTQPFDMSLVQRGARNRRHDSLPPLTLTLSPFALKSATGRGNEGRGLGRCGTPSPRSSSRTGRGSG